MGFVLEFVEAVLSLEAAGISLEGLIGLSFFVGLVFAAFNLGPALRDKIFKK